MNDFICINCNKTVNEEDRVYEERDWCEACVEKEGQRLMEEDSQELGEEWENTLNILGCDQERINTYKSFSRPPKYMLQPEEYEEFGY
jgi:hypothetical protein